MVYNNGKTLEDIVAMIMSISDTIEQKGFSDKYLRVCLTLMMVTSSST